MPLWRSAVTRNPKRNLVLEEGRELKGNPGNEVAQKKAWNCWEQFADFSICNKRLVFKYWKQRLNFRGANWRENEK